MIFFIMIMILVAFATISFLLGTEPQISYPYPNQHINDFSFSEYMSVSLEENGNSLFIKLLTVIAYPGAKFGRIIHNHFVRE